MSTTCSTRTGPTAGRRRGRRLALAFLALLLGPVSPSPSPAGARDAAAGDLHEVGRLPVVTEGINDVIGGTGLLVLNPLTRRGYQFSRDNLRTMVQSFDLDTLELRRRAYFEGWALVGAGAQAVNPGDLLHAVDERHGRIYFALHDTGASTGGLVEFPKDQLANPDHGATTDSQVAVSRFVALDEKAFDEGRPDFASTFDAPTPTDQFLWLRAMTVLPSTDGGPGRLLVVWTPPHNLASLFGAGPTVPHQLVAWDVADLRFDADATREDPTFTTRGAAEVLLSRQVVRECANAPMRHLPQEAGTYQWEVLLRPEGLYLGCQSMQGSGKVAFVPVGPDGTPPPGAEQRSFPLSRGVSEVLADPGGGRLLMKSYSLAGVTWWVFDARTRRFRGSVAVLLGTGTISAGVDPMTGRLYTAFADYSTGRTTVRGGLFSADTRLDPVPALESRDPVLTTSGTFMIRVDPPTRRVFLRRATGYGVPEPFYRVLRDDRPPAEPAPEISDRRFTVNTEEAEGATKASYLGTASGYGARALLVGGVGAATDRGTAAQSPCGSQDRELVVGQVASASLSDLSGSATAASLAGDADTEEQAGKPAQRCWPEAFGAPPTRPDEDGDGKPEPVDVTELEFDKDPQTQPGSDYRVQCVGGGEPPEAERSPRSGFAAAVDCGDEDRVEGRSTGGAHFPLGKGRDVWVGYSHSEVDVRRGADGGVVARVEAVARDVVVEGVGRIGVVRTVATSEAAGRDGTARGGFERSICGVDLTAVQLTRAGCLSEDDQQLMVAAFNRAFSGRGEMRLRRPDPKLFAGSRSGYSAAVQRDRLEAFEDGVVSRDKSLAAPGLEIVSYRGDHPDEGAGRQILQLAGVQAGTSYGIACLHGQSPAGDCRSGVDDGSDLVEGGPDSSSSSQAVDGDSGDAGDVGPEPGADDGSAAIGTGGDGDSEHPLVRLLRLPVRAAAEMLRLLFSSPRELGLLASVWGLMYGACYLGERRRTVRALRAVRLTANDGAR